ncbi:MAG: hypothetical protein JOZ38_10485 [Candidatus Eremiobacteraeota bacterium]|nr:hypothetical protein [Candidatus Eremiobacteraeota bacterium]
MVQQLRIALVVLFLGASAIVGWNLMEQIGRIHSSNVPGVDPSNPLAEFGIESAEHQAYVAAKVHTVQIEAAEMETGILTVAIVLWILTPVIATRIEKA